MVVNSLWAMLAATGGLAAVGVALVWWRKRPRRAEIAAVAAALDARLAMLRRARRRLESMRRDGTVERCVREGERRLGSALTDHLAGVDRRCAALVDGGFYGAALKSLAPSSAWKAEFRRRCDAVVVQIADESALEAAVEAVCRETADAIRRETVDGAPVQTLSPESLEVLMALERRPEAVARILGVADLAGDFGPAQAALSDALAGAGATLLAAALTVLVHEFGADAANVVVAHLVSELAGEVAEVIAEQLLAVVIAEAGEHAVTEIVEAVGVALTGLGVVFSAWKVMKYGRLIKRLAIDKEPLMAMRMNIREACAARARQRVEAAGAALRQGADGLVERLEAELGRLEAHTAEQRQALGRRWALAG